MLAKGQAKKNKAGIYKRYSKLAEAQAEALDNDANRKKLEAMNDYIADSGPTNGYLRGNVQLNEEQKKQQQEKIGLIDQVMNANKLGADITGYRAVSDVALSALLKQSGNKNLMSAIKEDGSIDHEKFANVKDQMVGMEYTDKGYGSTSVREDYAEEWRQGIRDREVGSMKQNEAFELGKNNPEFQEYIQKTVKEKGVESVDQLDNDTMHDLREKSREYLTQDQKDSLDQKGEQMKQNMGSHMFQINAKKGNKASMIDHMRLHDGKRINAQQDEMLIGRNGRYKITKIEQMMDENNVPMKNQYRIFMDLLGQEED